MTGTFKFTHPVTGEKFELPVRPLEIDHEVFFGQSVDDGAHSLYGNLECRLNFSSMLVGIIGAAASGKTTLANKLVEQFKFWGLLAIHVDGDAFTLPREIRFIQHDGYREDLITGPAIYDHEAMLKHLLELRDSGEHQIIIVDSVYIGYDDGIYGALDLLIGVYLDDAERLRRKILRDTGDPKRQIDIVADFAKKQIEEVADAIEPVFQSRTDIIWDASTGTLWHRRQSKLVEP